MDHFVNYGVYRRAEESSPSNPPSNSASALVSTLVPTLVIAGVMILCFLILRRVMRRQYEPRTFLSTLREQERSPSLSKGLFNWIGEFAKIPDSWVLNHQSIDGYLLLRFLKISTTMCLVGCCITFPILFPVTATAGGANSQLEVLNISNVPPSNNPRLYAHTFVAWIYFGFVWFMIARETIYYINIRQAFLLSPLYANRISSRTVLFSAVPDDFLDATMIRRMFGKKMQNHWIATDCKELEKLVAERDKVALRLEGAEIKLIKAANAARLKSLKKGAASHEEENTGASVDISGESGSAAARWIKPSGRPTHRLKPIIGKKVDTINWCRAELGRLIPEIQALQARHRAGRGEYVNSVFVEFYAQADAQAAFQTVAHHRPLRMSPRFVGINPAEVIWGNLRIKWWERLIRYAVVVAFICVLVLFWAVPVAFVGVLSNIGELRQSISWLSWMYSIPPVIFGVVSGLLPAVLLAVLMALLPIILRLAAKISGVTSLAQVELRTQNFYFTFQVVQVFLVQTLGAAATTTADKIRQNPGIAPDLLAQNLPRAANFYPQYFLVQGLTFAAGALLQIVGLILFRVLGKILDKTPRKMYKRWTSLAGLGWGTVFPIYTLMIDIAIIYACISPLIFLFSTIGLWLMYVAFRYNLIFVFNANIDTQGLVYPRALQHLTVGIYIGIVCMIGLFGINQSPGPTILMVVLLIASILFHISLSNAVSPLLNSIPKSLEVEEEHLMALENGAQLNGGSHNAEVDEKTGNVVSTSNGATSSGTTTLPAPHKKPNMITKFLRPDIYSDYQTLRRLVPRDFATIAYAPEVERDAYYNPAVSSAAPLLWIPRDAMGISRQEVAHTNPVIPMTDEGATLDDKGKIVWDPDTRPPIFEEKIYY